MAQDINMIRYGPYNLADQKHNTTKKIIFIPLYDKPWAISLGEIGMIEAPIYLDNNMIGIARFTLHVKMLKKVLTNLRLPKGEFVAVLDNQNHVIISSNQKDIVEVLQAKSLYKLHLHHINLATNRANLRLLKKEYIFKIVNISDTSLRLLIASNKKTLFKNIDKLHSQTVYFTILTLIIILFLFVYMYIYAKKQIQKVADDISKPLKQIVHSSHLIGKSIDFTIQDSKIVELSALVTNLRSTHKQLFDMIVYDAKMRIFNKTKLIQDIKEIDTLMLFAVENLSALQYLYGNMLIDDLLDKIVDEIKSLAGVTAYRVKEDVFALGMSGFDFNKLHLFYASLKLKKIKCGDIRFYVTLFAGIASTRDSENILGDAHLALMYARHNKISSPVTYQQARWLQGEFNKNIKWSSKLSDAFLQHRLEAYYQPVYDIKAGKIDKFEALVRLNEAGKVIPPLFFLEAAKNMGRIHDITIFMIKSVMQTASKHKNISFSINLSFKDFDDPEFLSFIKGTCEFYHVNPKNITFELLEADALDNLDISFNSINALKEMGFSIAIDDFGTGNSNFAHLMTMNVDYIKIDGQFIKDINQNAVSLHITHTIVQFSKLVGAKTVAEFVCNAEVLHSVKELGIDYAQGYEISKPVKASEIDVLLLKSN